jgi:Tfp pilus assembly protein PilO
VNSTVIRVVGWVIPVACMVVSSAAVYRQYDRIQVANEENAAFVKEFDAKQAELAVLRNKPGPEIRVAEPDSEAEATEFVEILKELAAMSGSRIEKLSDKRDSGTVKRDEKLSEDLQAVVTNVEVSGDYLAVRNFVTSLRTAPRLVVLSTANWKREDRRTTLNLTITRYVKGKSG